MSMINIPPPIDQASLQVPLELRPTAQVMTMSHSPFRYCDTPSPPLVPAERKGEMGQTPATISNIKHGQKGY